VGGSIAKNESELKSAVKKAAEFGGEIIVEEYLLGTEVSCGVLGNKNPWPLPVIEICPKKDFFDYEAKYTVGMCEEIVPARIDPKMTEKVQKTATEVFKFVGARGFSRIDMILVGMTPYVLEINTIPGLTPNSLLPKEAKAAGISYPKLLDLIINFALEER
jgi:D-alanine-D-alanine ligase